MHSKGGGSLSFRYVIPHLDGYLVPQLCTQYATGRPTRVTVLDSGFGSLHIGHTISVVVGTQPIEGEMYPQGVDAFGETKVHTGVHHLANVLASRDGDVLAVLFGGQEFSDYLNVRHVLSVPGPGDTLVGPK